MSQPCFSASYSAAQSSALMTPLCTSRSTVPPPSRPSMRYSIAMNEPSSPVLVREADGECHRSRASLACLDVLASHEPGVDARAGGDRLPDLLGGGVQLDLAADL